MILKAKLIVPKAKLNVHNWLSSSFFLLPAILELSIA